MKNLLYSALVIILFVTSPDLNAQQIDFTEIKSEQDWVNVLASAETLGKPVFLDIYATWCGPCKQMDALVFANTGVAEFYNENFVNSKVDGESEFGMVLVRKYGLRGFPTMYYLGYDDFMYSKIVGFRPADAFLEYGKKIDENKSLLREYDRDFKMGNLVGERVREYVELLTELNVSDRLAELSNLYITTLSEEDIRNPENRGLILNSSLTFETDQFGFILNNADEFSEMWGREEYQNLLEKVFQEALHRAAMNKDLELRDRLGNELMGVYFRGDDESVIYGKFLTKKLYHAISENWEGYIDEVEDHYLNEKKEDKDFLTQEVYQILQNQFSSEELLTSALEWVNIILEERKTFEPYYLGSIIKVYLDDMSGALEMIENAENYASPEELDNLAGVKNYIKELTETAQ